MNSEHPDERPAPRACPQDGGRIYENRTVLVLRTRWGKIVEQEDFYIDTGRFPAFDRKLAELGVDPVPKPS